MRKIWKTLVAVCLMIAVSATTASAATITKNGTSTSTIAPNSVNTGSENINSFPNYNISYGKSDVIKVNGDKKFGVIIPVTVPAKGDVYFSFNGTPTVSASMEIRLYTDSACSSKVDYTYEYIYSASDISKPLEVTCPAKGTYYLAVYSDYTKLTANSISFRSYFYSAADRTLTSGRWSASAGWDGNYRYYKMALKDKGHILVQSDTDQSVEICNSSKTVIYDSAYLSSSNGRKASYYLNPGTYYIRSKGNSSGVSKMRYTFCKLGSSPYVLKNKKSVTVNPGTGKAYHYIKYKAGVTGYVTLNATGSQSAYLTLCNSSRKALSSEDWIYGSSSTSNRVAYGVKKGQTYYIKIKSSHNPFKLGLRETAVKEKSGSSKKKAVAVKANKTVKGSIQAGSKTADWYKIKVTKRKNVTITLKGSTNDKLQASVYTASGRNIGSTSMYDYGYGRSLKSVGKLSKGTYYIKIVRGNSKSSGYYSLKWK